MDTEIVKADRTYRRRLFVAYGVSLLAGAAAIRFGIPFVKHWLGAMPPMQAYRMFEPLLIGFLICFSPAAVYLIVIGRRILRYDAFPYPGMKVIRDTRMLRGPLARRQGWALVGLGGLFLLLMVTGSAVIHWSFSWFLRLFSGG
jgi:hypothetical protein